MDLVGHGGTFKLKNVIIIRLALLSALMSLLSLAPCMAADTHPVISEDGWLDEFDSVSLKSRLSQLELGQKKLGHYVQSWGEQVDLFMGDEQVPLKQKGSRLNILAPTTFYDDGDIQTTVKFRAQWDLPRTNHRWKVLLSSFEETVYEDTASTTSVNSSASRPTLQNPSTVYDPNNTENTNSVAARYLLNLGRNDFSYIDAGFNFTGLLDPNPYVRFKTRYKVPLTQDVLSRTTQNLFWERKYGIAWQAQQVFDYQYQPSDLLRAQTTGTWWRDQGEYLLNQKMVWYKTINPHRVHSYYVDGNWTVLNEGATFTNAAVGINWRERLYKDWLFGEVEPKVSWSEDTQFKTPIFSVLVMLEMRFYAGI
jgi:hypothetical protein